MSEQRRSVGFTLIEFVMVIAISTVLIVGLSAVIEIPRMVLEQRETGQNVSAVDRVLSVLDRDIRFASDVRVTDSERTLEIDTGAGQTIYYRWAGSAGDPVIRTDVSGSSSVAKGVQGCRFSLKTATKTVAVGLALGQDDTALETATFDTFQLQPGFTWSSAAGRQGSVTGVTRSSSAFGISDQRRPGFWLEATGLQGDDGTCSSFRARLRRYGSGDLEVRIYEAYTGSKLGPKRNKLVGIGFVSGASLPGSFTDVTISMTSVKKMKHKKAYFIELSSDRSDFAAEIQVETVSNSEAITSTNGGLTRSTDYGGAFDTFSDTLSSSQSPFSLLVVQSEPDTDGAVPATNTVEIVIAVRLELKVDTSGGEETLEAMFPLLNKLAELR